MAGERTVTIRILGDAGGAQKAFKVVEEGAGKMEGVFSKIGGAVAKAATVAGGFLGAQVITKAADYLQDAGKQAVSLEQNAKKAAVVFEGSLPTVQAWAKENASAMGLSAAGATTLAANMADLLKPMGFTADAAAKMSTDTVGLAGALAEWSGGTKSAAEVSDILTSAMLGETDGLKALGISLSADEIAKRASENAAKGLTFETEEQAKAIATQQLITEKSADAQKAFAEGAGSAARKQAEANAAMQEGKEKLAAALLPAITLGTTLFATFATILSTKVVPAITGVVGFLGRMREYLGPLVGGLAGVGAVILASVIPAFIAWAAAAIPAATATIIALAPIIAIALAVGAAVALLFLAWQKNFFGIRDIVGSVISFVTDVFNTVRDLVTGDWSQMWTGLKDAVSNAWTSVKDAVTGGIDAVKGMFSDAATWLINAGSSIIQGLKDGISSFVQDQIAGWTVVYDTVTGWFSDALSWLLDKGQDVIRGLKDGVTAFIDAEIRGWTIVYDTVTGWFSDALNWLVDLGKDIVRGLKDGITWLIDTEVKGMTLVYDTIVGWFTAAATWLEETGKTILRGLKSGITWVVDNEIKGWTAIYDAVTGMFSTASTWLSSAGKNILKGLIDGIESKIQDVKSKLSEVTGLIPDWKGPPSKDAKLLYESGQLIMRGLVGGIMSQTGDLQRTLGAVTDMVNLSPQSSLLAAAVPVGVSGSRGMSAAPSTAAAPVRSSGSTTNIYGNVINNVQQPTDIAETMRKLVP